MSVCRWIGLLTDTQKAKADRDAGWGECWFHTLPAACYYAFGDDRDTVPRKAFAALHGVPLSVCLDTLLDYLDQSSADNKDLTRAALQARAKHEPDLRVWYHAE